MAAESVASAAAAVDHNDADSNLLESRQGMKEKIVSALKDPNVTKIEIKAIVREVEDLYLEETNGFSNVLYDLNGQGFPLLKKLHIQNNANIKHIIFSSGMKRVPRSFPILETMILDNLNNLEEICHGRQLIIGSFQKLKVIKVKSCGRLEYLFSISEINKFSQLVEIEVSECSSMKNIVLLDSGTTIDEIESIPLRSLTLQHLPAINGFCCRDSESLAIPTLFPNEKALFRPLKHLKLISVSRIMLLVITALSKGMVPLQNLETMEIEGCNDLQYLFVIKGLNMHENYGGLLSDLRELRLLNLGKLRSIVGLNHPARTLSFNKLNHLRVCGCNQLRYVVPLHVLQNLPQLETIVISDCKMLERVFGDDEEDTQMRESTANPVLLRQVKSLILEELPKLSGCCQDGCTVEWLSLKRVRVVECPMIQKSSLGTIDRPLLTSVEVIDCNTWSNNEDPEGNIVYLFHLTDELSRLEELKIKDSEELKKYMEMKFQDSSFSSLRLLEARRCDQEFNKFLCILLRRSRGLKELTVENCQLLEHVLDLTQFVPEEPINLKFPRLKTMQLRCLPNLNCIWNKDPVKIVELGKLVKLEIIECGLLKSALTAHLVEKLVHLKELKIESCQMIEQIVEDGTEMEMQQRSFRNLEDLQLASLPKLILFNSGHWNFRFPNLQSLRIEKCPQLNAFATGFLSNQTLTVEGTSDHVQPNEMMDACSKLQKLNLVGLKSFEEIWHGPHIPECELTEVEVDSFSNLRYIFPSSMLQIMLKLETLVVRNCTSLSNLFQVRENDSIMAFQNLKIVRVKGCDSLQGLLLPCSYPSLIEIDISGCQSLKEIFIDTEIKADQKCFPNLESIVLENLPTLASFSLEMFEFPKLKKARIVKCPAFKTFSTNLPAKANNFMDTDSSESPPFGHGKTILLPQLQVLGLSDLPTMRLWNQEPQIPVFKELTSLKIIGCGSLEKLFSISVAEHLSSLKWLTLYKCEKMVQVLQGGGGSSKRVFQKLETLVLKHLPTLTSFSGEDVEFGEFPELKMVRVEHIANMSTFVKKPLNTPKLKQVHVTFITKWWQGNLNNTITDLHKNHSKLKDEVWESD